MLYNYGCVFNLAAGLTRFVKQNSNRIKIKKITNSGVVQQAHGFCDRLGEV